MITHEYALLGIKITNYTAAINAAINHEVGDTRECAGDEKIYSFDSRIEIEGLCTYPEGQEDSTYSITIYGGERPDRSFSLTLKDCHQIDDDYMHVYRKVRGTEVPVYNVPKDIGCIERQRGTKHWRGAVWVPIRTVTDMLTLLPHTQPLYLDIQTLIEKKYHGIRSLSLQTNDPATS